jgi:hypothetical protein
MQVLCDAAQKAIPAAISFGGRAGLRSQRNRQQPGNGTVKRDLYGDLKAG